MLKFLVVLLILSGSVQAGQLTVAAASDLKFALSEIQQQFVQSHPQEQVRIVYGSSGKFAQQIEQGAPFDLYFSASIEYPERLAKQGLTATQPKLYAKGKIVLWSARVDARQLRLVDLAQPRFRRIAIANPRHAPYGLRAKQALQSAGVWTAVKPKLVLGENIAQTAQMVEMGGADVGVIALSLALSPRLRAKGHFRQIPQSRYAPLLQAFVVTQHGAKNPLAYQFAEYIQTPKAQSILKKYGFDVH